MSKIRILQHLSVDGEHTSRLGPLLWRNVLKVMHEHLHPLARRRCRAGSTVPGGQLTREVDLSLCCIKGTDRSKIRKNPGSIQWAAARSNMLQILCALPQCHACGTATVLFGLLNFTLVSYSAQPQAPRNGNAISSSFLQDITLLSRVQAGVARHFLDRAES